MHRDLKPENILIDENLHVKIVSSFQNQFSYITLTQIDFGDAKEFDDSVYNFELNPRQSKALRQTGEFSFDIGLLDKKETFVGTPFYVAPEMLTDCKALPAGDLWSLGIIIYRMITGKCPFNEQGQQQTFQKILSLDYEWPQDIQSPELRAIVERLLKLSPQDRLGAG